MSWWFGRKSAPEMVSPYLPGWLRAGEDEGFARSLDGMSAYVRSSGITAVYVGSSWLIGTLSGSQVNVDGVKVVGARGAAIAAPTGGTTVDAQARTAIGLILNTLRQHGLIEM